ncbi:MAG: acyl-ACP thioesterase, partial [Turicibacter sanguinis]
ATDTFPKVTIRPCQIDTNCHVNNSHYVALALECLPQELEIKRVRVEYKKAAKCGDIMIPASVSLDGIYYVSLNDEEGHPYAILSFNE